MINDDIGPSSPQHCQCPGAASRQRREDCEDCSLLLYSGSGATTSMCPQLDPAPGHCHTVITVSCVPTLPGDAPAPAWTDSKVDGVGSERD